MTATMKSVQPTIKPLNPLKAWWMERVLWWRSFWPVMFAHKPLCDRFHTHTIRVGRTHVCRSCAILYVSMALSVMFFVVLMQGHTLPIEGMVGIAGLTMVLSFPPLYKNLPRIIKDGVRALLGVSIAGTIMLAVDGQWPWAAGMAVGLWGAKLLFQMFRARRSASACDSCPEYRQNQICSGYRLKARRMRIYERVLTQKILRYQRFSES